MTFNNGLMVAAGLCCFSALANGAVLQVGADKPYKAPCAAITAAANGDTVEIDAGLYVNDICSWTKDNLTIRGINGRPHLHSDLAIIPNRKGIWVAAGRNLLIENIEFSGAKADPIDDKNGAGLRAQGTDWTVRNCYFHDNEDGILESNVAASHVVIENTEFANNGFGDGQSHNLYIGHCASLVFRYNYSHDAKVGHL